ncbi:BTB/POZ domain and ankyrin repeat-containing protein NPR1-like isoform X2 [Rhodamnia argentea]|uniref:BTB/POZ domain and ankyrin repeat-containing protein NPR1-like isoform X2 n=1 Tax=Rhodamnia argentea TaxID=178133 RepID=A0ABM3GRJ4_9MYRT|nr:BTB/POZ domain and ankyrin repeat-containing protein NPR1-like isoform X2 [Rhodamnia argentea]
MDNGNELSSPSSYLSNGSTDHDVLVPAMNLESGNALDLLSLSKLSSSLEKLLVGADYNYSDVEIVVEGISVGVHRCLLAARSRFFHELFKKGNGNNAGEGKPRYLMSEMVSNGRVGYEAFDVLLSYIYTGKLKPFPATVSTCVDSSCTHDACLPAINYAVELMYASATFQIKEFVMLIQRRLFYFVKEAAVEDVVPILVVASDFQLNELLSCCIERVAGSHMDSIVLEKALPHEVYTKIKVQRDKFGRAAEPMVTDVNPLLEKKIKQVHRALDSDDVELVRRLLHESNVTLDDAFALHYATAFCDPKVFKEVLGLGLADLNLKDSQGYTVLHLAARRKAPSILMALLAKGACAVERMSDVQTAVTICRRSTRPKDYNQETKQGQESNKDRICIDVLEREMQCISVAGYMSNYVSISTDATADDIMRLDYLASRVKFAGTFFPAEAKLAMEIADAEWTSLYKVLASKSLNGKQVDLNEGPAFCANELQLKLQALRRTVEMGRRYFPHCSDVLDNFLDEVPDDFFLEKGTSEEKRNKKARFMELKEEVQKAVCKDMAENKKSGWLSASSSSSSPRQRIKKK